MYKGGESMFLAAILCAVAGGIFTAIGNAANSTPFKFFGGVFCLVSGILFLINGISIFF